MHRTGHSLLLHYSEKERLTWLADWFLAGFGIGQRAVYVDVAGWGREDLMGAFERRGFDIAGPLLSGQLAIVPRDAALDLGGDGHDHLYLEALRDGFSGLRLSIRQDALTAAVGDEAAAVFEQQVDALCGEVPISVACQYDGRRIGGEDLTRVLDLHTAWVFESEFSLHHRGRVIDVEGSLDSFDSDVLYQALVRMTETLPGGAVTLDLRAIKAITKGACEALVAGTAALRARGGAVRVVAPPGSPSWMLVLRDSVAGSGIELVHPGGATQG